MDLKNKKILVTGADGFIGSHLTEELVRCGHDVRALVYYNSLNSWGWLEDLPVDVKNSLDVHPGDIRDPHVVKNIVKGCDVIFHLAALIAIPYSYHAPASYVDTNIHGTLNLLQAAREHGIQKFIHTSTSEVYGTAQKIPITEDHPLRAQSPYAATKVAADQLALSFYDSFELPVAVIRPFNTYGPRQSTRAIIPAIITQIASRQPAIKLGDLHPTRDFTYVEDTVRGFIAIAESEHSVGEVINIGSGSEISMQQTADLIAELMNVSPEVLSEKQRMRPAGSEVERLCADYSKAKKLTGWSPVYHGEEGFRRGLEQTIEWFTQMENLTKYKTNFYAL